jgi:hypothetical protein
MKNRFILAQLVFVLVIITAAVLAADPEAPVSFDLSWHTIDAGGGECFGGGNIELHGTIGQPDAGVALTGGAFELVGGFWPGSVEPGTRCPADIAGGDGLINIDDLLLVINFWGQGGGAPGDANGNGSVDIDDLLLIINAWGACP